MISIGLNLILGMLLTCALILGIRLERKLRGLRQSHTDFAKAVNELDGAAVRTETSLQALRAGTETAKTELTSRIDQARIACQRLEKLTSEAERLANQPLPLAHPLAPASSHQPSALARPVERVAPPQLAQAAVGMSAFARPEPEAMRPAAPVQTRPAPAPAPARSRARMLDDDLFAMEPPPPARPVERSVERPMQRHGERHVAPSQQAPVRQVERDAFVETMAEPVMPEFARPQPAFVQPRMPEPPTATVVPLRADNDPIVGLPKDRAAREAFYREVLDRETFTPDAFDDGQFAYERRAMLAAVTGGRR